MHHLLLVAIFLVLKYISCDAGIPVGLEFKQVKFCGPHYDKSAKMEISPWPFLKSGEKFQMNLTFTPAVDVFAATFQYEVISVADGRILGRGRENACRHFPELCSLPADETHVLTYTDITRTFPPGFQITFKAPLQMYNEENIMFLCFEIVAAIH